MLPDQYESAPPMGLVTPPDQQGQQIDELLQQVLALISHDGELDEFEMRALNAFGQGLQMIQQQRMQRMGAPPPQGPGEPAPGGGEMQPPGGNRQPYGQVPGAAQKPIGLSGGF